MDVFNVFLIDSDRLFREGLKRILTEGTYDVVGEARSIGEARDALESAGDIDLVVFDPKDWDAQGTEAFVERLRARGIKIAVLTGDRSRGVVAKAVGWSVDAYLLKDMAPEALTRSLQLVMLGQQIFPTSLMASLMAADAPEPAAGSSIRGLSPREVQILRHLTTGHSNKAIARALDISEATVKVHLKALLRKVRANNRTQAAIWAMNNGLGTEVA
jgi:two-component system, NarL family, nitrate/nitrite response regulator NarL